MTALITKPNLTISRITAIVDKIIQEDSIYEELDRNDLISTLSNLFNKLDPQELKLLDDDEFEKIVSRIMSIKLIYGMLDDFTPEEMARFDESVKRR